MIFWIVLTLFIFLDISGIWHILPSLDSVLIGKNATLNYENNGGTKISLIVVLLIFLLLLMIVGTIMSYFVPLTETIEETDEYGNVYRSSKVASLYSGKNKTGEKFTSNNQMQINMDGDPGIQIIPGNGYYNTLNYNTEKRSYNNYKMLSSEENPYRTDSNMNNMNNYNTLNKNGNNNYNTLNQNGNNGYNTLNQNGNNNYNTLNQNDPRYDELYTPPSNSSNYLESNDIKFYTLSSTKPDAYRSMASRSRMNVGSNTYDTWDRNFASKKAHEARETYDQQRNRDMIRERERERMRENRKERDRMTDDRDYDRGETNDDRDNNGLRVDTEISSSDKNSNLLSPSTISSKKELETYLRNSTISIMRRSGGGYSNNPKFVSMFEIEENASSVSEGEEFSMNNFTIKCKICKKDIPIEDVENHQCESKNIPLINVETEEHKQAMKEKEEKERLEREKEEKERKRKERSEREKERRRRRDRDRDRDRDRRRDDRSRDRNRKRDERSRDRDYDRGRRDDKYGTRERNRDIERNRSRNRDIDRSRSRNRDIDRSQSRNRDERREIEHSRSRRRPDEIREGYCYDISTEYEQVLNDEVTVKYGQTFEVEKIFEDGWCVGTNLATGSWGAIPMNCLSNKQERRRRIQSLYME